MTGLLDIQYSMNRIMIEEQKQDKVWDKVLGVEHKRYRFTLAGRGCGNNSAT
jgi:hypothetical protein